MKDDKAVKAFAFFLNHIGDAVTVDEIIEATDWTTSTVKTYISKKWPVFLEKIDNQTFKVTEQIQRFNLESFLQLQTQKFDKKYLAHFNSTASKNTAIIDNEYAIEQAYLDYLNIENFVCINKVELHNLAKSKEIYFLGENGDGKTLLLQAILITLKRPFLATQVSRAFLGRIIDLFPDIRLFGEQSDLFSMPCILYAKDDSNQIYDSEIDVYLKNIYAYGVHRSYNNGTNVEPYGFSSLFINSVALKQPDDWLKEIRGQELESQLEPQTKDTDSSISLSTVITLLKEILDNNLEIHVSLREDRVKYIERGAVIRFELLSEGYKSVLVWVIDLLSRLVENQPHVKKNQDFVGIVLVDEINLHLHPKWEYELVKKLRQWFPKIQFIFTTHSPITILGASKDAVFYRLYKENGETKVSEPYTAAQLQPLMANSIITSPLFDLDTARMRIFNRQETELDTSESYLDSRIRAEVDKQVKALKQAGKIYISAEEIDALIKQAIEQLKEE